MAAVQLTFLDTTKESEALAYQSFPESALEEFQGVTHTKKASLLSVLQLQFNYSNGTES